MVFVAQADSEAGEVPPTLAYPSSPVSPASSGGCGGGRGAGRGAGRCGGACCCACGPHASSCDPRAPSAHLGGRLAHGAAPQVQRPLLRRHVQRGSHGRQRGAPRGRVQRVHAGHDAQHLRHRPLCSVGGGGRVRAGANREAGCGRSSWGSWASMRPCGLVTPGMPKKHPPSARLRARPAGARRRAWPPPAWCGSSARPGGTGGTGSSAPPGRPPAQRRAGWSAGVAEGSTLVRPHGVATALRWLLSRR